VANCLPGAKKVVCLSLHYTFDEQIIGCAEYYGEEASIIEGAADADASSDEDDQWVEVPSAFVDGSNGAGDGKGGEAKWDVVLGERVEAVTSVEKRLPATSTPNSAG
jgi:hypothetical protein